MPTWRQGPERLTYSAEVPHSPARFAGVVVVNFGDRESRKARLRGLPEGMQQVLASKLPEDVAVKDIKQCSRKSECQCPGRGSERFFCEVCQKPTNSLGMWNYALPHSRACVTTWLQPGAMRYQMLQAHALT